MGFFPYADGGEIPNLILGGGACVDKSFPLKRLALVWHGERPFYETALNLLLA